MICPEIVLRANNVEVVLVLVLLTIPRLLSPIGAIARSQNLNSMLRQIVASDYDLNPYCAGKGVAGNFWCQNIKLSNDSTVFTVLGKIVYVSILLKSLSKSIAYFTQLNDIDR